MEEHVSHLQITITVFGCCLWIAAFTFCLHLSPSTWTAKHCDSTRRTPARHLSPSFCCTLQLCCCYLRASLTQRRWDDWVEEDRLRKLTQENRELANSLRHAVLEQQRAARAQAVPAKKKAQTSTRGSEERQTPAQAAPPRGQKRMRDQDLEKVSVLCFLFA